MAKKKSISNYLNYIPIITIAVGLIVSWAKFSVSADNTKTEVKELKNDTKIKIEKVEADIKEITKESSKEISELKGKDKDLEKIIDGNQIQQNNIEQKVIEISTKQNQIVDLLLELKRKK